MAIPLFHVDAFTDRPFAGNPAAVCLLPEARSDAWLQQVAAEMNLSETAFLVPREDGFQLRWLTPEIEVDLCGHATLASAHVLWETGRLGGDQAARFHTRSGLLTAERTGSGIRLDFPAKPAVRCADEHDLASILQAPPRFVGRSNFDYLVEVESEAVVRRLQPDFARLARVPVRGLIVTAASATPEFDCVSRFFAPGSGVWEDPVTGSAHCTLGPFWGERLGKTVLRAYQASARGGRLEVQLRGERVHLIGQAVTVARGELLAA